MEKNSLLDLQNTILDIVLYFDSFCKKHQITYYLMGGSALGAMRHQGFIPWDDDFDVFLDAENYNKLLALKDEITNENYSFFIEGSKENPYYFSKLKKNNTIFIDEETINFKDSHRGIYIDIMCLHNLSNCKFKAKMQYYAAALLKTNALTKVNYVTNSRKKKILLSLSKIVNLKCIKALLLKIVKSCDKKNTEKVFHFFGRAKFDKAVYERLWFKEPVYVKFDKYLLPVPTNCDAYLTTRYGLRYMEMPDQKTRDLYKSHAMYWNCYSDEIEEGKEF